MRINYRLFSLISCSIVVSADRPRFSTIQPNPTQVAKAAETAVSYDFSRDPIVPGTAFDRVAIIWLENTDYDKASQQYDLKLLASNGIQLTNYFALTHTSQPNYMAAVGGDYFGLNNDDFVWVPKHVRTLVDLLDTKNISWGEYQEHMPYTGYQGFEWLNQNTRANDYVRKHNPLIHFQSVADDPERLSRIKNFTLFDKDVSDEAVPQWMFITPNMTNIGHDTHIGVAGKWSASFIPPLLENDYFNNNTLLIVTFDENETYQNPNQVMTFLLGDAVPDELRGTRDDTYYDHYSLISTVTSNWALPSLGRHDCNANVFQFVADKTGYTNRFVDSSPIVNNESLPGYFRDGRDIPDANEHCSPVSNFGPQLDQIVLDI